LNQAAQQGFMLEISRQIVGAAFTGVTQSTFVRYFKMTQAGSIDQVVVFTDGRGVAVKPPASETQAVA
jgi:hypothetical protein